MIKIENCIVNGKIDYNLSKSIGVLPKIPMEHNLKTKTFCCSKIEADLIDTGSYKYVLYVGRDTMYLFDAELFKEKLVAKPYKQAGQLAGVVYVGRTASLITKGKFLQKEDL